MDEQSRNSWINKDEPTNVSSMARFKEDFEDILYARRLRPDIGFSLKTRKNVPHYKHRILRTPDQIKKHVLNSDRVKYRVEQIAREKRVSQEEVLKESEVILNEMAHQLNLPAIRGFAFFLIKIFKALFSRIYVNEEGVQKLRRLMHDYPVLLMPSHRSYMDFLLVSYVFFHYDLPMPVIAAAMDFQGMAFFGWLLRNCGAFYIRRSFGTDQLYWAVFTEYVQTHLRNGDSPLEFFVEGTRSRTAKSYTPKIGMLSASLESYYKAEVPDVIIVPISISYERILEETIYAYELLGVPKPKESASGLFKARNILKQDFGSVHFYFGEPISIRDLSAGELHRSVHNLEPRYINNLTDEEGRVARKLSYEIVRIQQQHFVISPWSLMAAVLIQCEDGLTVKQLVKEVEWLKRQAYNLAAYVDWPGNASSEAVIRHYIHFHDNIVRLGEGEEVGLLVDRCRGDKPMKDVIMTNAANHLILASYRNQLLHIFVRTAMVALAVNNCHADFLTHDELFKKYQFLEGLLSRDFVFQPGATQEDFNQALLTLTNSGSLSLVGDTVHIKKSINKHTTFLSQLFEPFLLGYWVVCQHLLSLTHDVHGRPLPKKPKEICRDAQMLGIRLLQEGILNHYDILSLDLINNALSVLIDLNAMHKDKRIEETYISPKTVEVSNIAAEIATFIDVPLVPGTVLAAKTVVLSAKL